MSDTLRTPNDYSSLSLKDLLCARDLYHYHLINKPNVMGSAISLYLQRRPGTPKEEARTFANSEVRDNSWPCVLVLVRAWQPISGFGTGKGQMHPDDLVPRTLYMPDGKRVPVCVVEVKQAEADVGRLPDWHWPSGMYGGGMPIVVDSQERELAATTGCLVTDGHNIYALTSGHVCGNSGDPVYTISRGQRVRIGRATGKRLTREDFTKLYPEFPGQRTFVQMDVGLIEIENARDWTSQIYGLGMPGPLADLNEWNLSTRLINAPVVATGAASGRLDGRIRALFYRYKSIGGYDYVADFLISPQEGDDSENTPASCSRPGDSGTVWHLETEDSLRPIAVQWGGQGLQQQDIRTSYTLATSLTTVCQALNVEVILQHNVGVAPYWGQVGHYTIASFACDTVKDTKLRTFIRNNVSKISFTMAELTPKQISDTLKAARNLEVNVPLADVPDIVWKQHVSKMEGGRDPQWAGAGRSTGPEHPTHYADIDEPRSSDGKTLRQLSLEDPANISVEFWQQFYDAAGHTQSSKRGLLPFRVWQFFNVMVRYARKKKPAEYLCAAGLLAHYVGDACQPLHGSMYADGYVNQPLEIVHHKRDTGEEYVEHSHQGAGVHSTYESKMIDRYTPRLLAWIADIRPTLPALPAIPSGHAAAAATIELMDRSAQAIPPTDLVDAYIAAGGQSTVAVQEALWNQFGEATAGVMADGARVLAAIWDGAWKAGGGGTIATSKLGGVYRNPVQRTDVTGRPHGDIDTPHTHEYGPPNTNPSTGPTYPGREINVRPATPEEIPEWRRQ